MNSASIRFGCTELGHCFLEGIKSMAIGEECREGGKKPEALIAGAFIAMSSRVQRISKIDGRRTRLMHALLQHLKAG
jgi:hypothetical protein